MFIYFMIMLKKRAMHLNLEKCMMMLAFSVTSLS